MKRCTFWSSVALSLLIMFGKATSTRAEEPALREVVGDRMLIGAAIQAAELQDARNAAFIAKQFNCLTPGNEMKPDALQRVKGKFTFDRADIIVDFAQKHGMAVIGHTSLTRVSCRWIAGPMMNGLIVEPGS